MTLSANQIRAIEAENLIYNGINIVGEILRDIDGYSNAMSWSQKEALVKWLHNAKEWQGE